jgi:hypothetical protein
MSNGLNTDVNLSIWDFNNPNYTTISTLPYSFVTTDNISNPVLYTDTSAGRSLHVEGDASFEGDIKIKGKSLGKILETIEDRLAILQDPDPKKLEKFQALKKAYDHYKLMEKLIGE